MAVLVEAISVIIRAHRLEEVSGERLDRLLAQAPNRTFCTDGELVRAGFMAGSDAHAFVRGLEGRGLVFLHGGRAQDIAVLDQQRGPLVPCDWVEVFRASPGTPPGATVTACRLRGGAPLPLAVPEGWTYPGSLSESFVFYPRERDPEGLTFVGVEDGVEVWRSERTGDLHYVGRTRC